MVKPFVETPGIISVVSGYTGGHTKNPTYEEVCSGITGHTEAVKITFDHEVFPYSELVKLFWRQIDPTDAGGQFYDRGESYKQAVYYHNENQKKIAEQYKQELDESGIFNKAIVTEILPATTFYPAEEYHQDYYKKNPLRYSAYQEGSGRAAYIRKHWGDRHE
ncbi:peptide-methionine (S)-S-oxide reductase MsrA [Bacillus massilinigeriensis]|uniref:peptide-methionine (S)-S-oxide reductase MsrA n=1 Tax=Bacillus mediterraneensis TaxID=1805474 RepID=UPI0008F8D0D1|nr:peptide-methionine (S)-S-oxide reductase MsrA [Bacillus mediterraneensis]